MSPAPPAETGVPPPLPPKPGLPLPISPPPLMRTSPISPPPCVRTFRDAHGSEDEEVMAVESGGLGDFLSIASANAPPLPPRAATSPSIFDRMNSTIGDYNRGKTIIIILN